MTSTPCAEGIEVIMFRTIGDGPSEWESRLPAEVLRLPEELARVDALLDDPVFFAPFTPYFHPVLGRPSTPVEWYLRLMFLKFRHRLGYESLCAEVSDSISWRRFCRIGLDGAVQLAPAVRRIHQRAQQVPHTVTADRGYGEPAVERDLQALGVSTIVIPAKPNHP